MGVDDGSTSGARVCECGFSHEDFCGDAAICKHPYDEQPSDPSGALGTDDWRSYAEASDPDIAKAADAFRDTNVPGWRDETGAPDTRSGHGATALPGKYDRENRIRANRRLLETLADLWDAHPDQRFGQLVKNLSRDDGGFADTWEWKHGQWRERIERAWSEWAK